MQRVFAGVVAGCLAVLAGCSSVAAPRHSSTSSPARSASTVSTAPTHTAPRSTPTPTPTPTASKVAAAPGPCARNHDTKRIIVSVRAQRTWLCAHTRLVYTTLVTTGAVDLPYDATPTGTFHVQAIEQHRVLTLLSGEQYTVKYWIPFDAPLFGFHDSPWQTLPYGSQQYRTKGSHGCVHTPLAALRFMAGWASVGTPVRIKR